MGKRDNLKANVSAGHNKLKANGYNLFEEMKFQSCCNLNRHIKPI